MFKWLFLSLTGDNGSCVSGFVHNMFMQTYSIRGFLLSKGKSHRTSQLNFVVSQTMFLIHEVSVASLSNPGRCVIWCILIGITAPITCEKYEHMILKYQHHYGNYTVSLLTYNWLHVAPACHWKFTSQHKNEHYAFCCMYVRWNVFLHARHVHFSLSVIAGSVLWGTGKMPWHVCFCGWEDEIAWLMLGVGVWEDVSGNACQSSLSVTSSFSRTFTEHICSSELHVFWLCKGSLPYPFFAKEN